MVSLTLIVFALIQFMTKLGLNKVLDFNKYIQEQNGKMIKMK